MIPFAVPRWVYIALAVALALFTLYRYGYHNGWTDRDVDMQLAIAQKNEESRAKEQAAAQAIAAKDEQLRKANNEIDKKQADMRRLAAAGQLRLPTARCVSTAQDATAASVDRDTGPSELERQTVEALIAIAADGDRAAEQANACIAAYNQVMELINGDR